MADFTPTTEQVRTGYAYDPEGEYRDPINAPINERWAKRAFDRWLESVKREAAAVALEEAATMAMERAKEYSETAHRLIAARAFEDSSRYFNYAAGLTMAAGISRTLATPSPETKESETP